MGGVLCHLEGDKEVGLVTVSWWPRRRSELYLRRFGVSVSRHMCEGSEGSPMSPPPWMLLNRGNQRKDSKRVWSELVNPGHAFLSWSLFFFFFFAPHTCFSGTNSHERCFAKKDTTLSSAPHCKSKWTECLKSKRESWGQQWTWIESMGSCPSKT